MAPNHFDVIVIGTGPGGEGAAMKAVKSGKSVAVAERFPKVGGGCTHWGTIPSKALRQTLRQFNDIKSHPVFEKAAAALDLDFPAVLKESTRVIEKQVKLRRGFYDRNRVRVLSGQAAFVDKNTIEVKDPGGSREKFSADAFVVACGARPYHPPDVDFGHRRVLDSDKVLGLSETPSSLTIYGAGVIGCEYASIFRHLGVKVNLVNTRKHLLDFLDDEITDAVSYHLRNQGVLIRHGEAYESVAPDKDGVVLKLRSGKKLKSEYLLWANGRTGNTDAMGLENIGLKPDQRGNIPVNGDYQTALKHIYAVGDVLGFPSLASASYDQGRSAATHLVEGKCDHRLVEHIPTGIFTSPEISSVGPTEKELTEKKTPYEVGHAAFKNLARAQITGCPVGMLKILFHRRTLAVLAVHCFGYEASEIVHIGQAIMSQKGKANTLMYFINTTFNYPTMAEAYRVAALNGLNRLKDS